VPLFTLVLDTIWLGETLQPAVAAKMLLIFSDLVLSVVESRCKASSASAPHASQICAGPGSLRWLRTGLDCSQQEKRTISLAF
jgi:hypothetical protein